MTDEATGVTPPEPKERQGLLIVYTGNGKGKTTAALGLAFRALGHGMKILMIQYIKGKWKTGEKKLADRLAPDIEIRPMGDGFTWDTNNPAQDIATTARIWEVSREAIQSGKYDIVILDEINVVMKLGYLDPQVVVDFLKGRDPRLHVVLTGRGAPPAIIEAADLVSEVQMVKHPFRPDPNRPHKPSRAEGIKAQRGIEF
ncbi:MAG: cob(I)yrinic acid a,c-diamide adenosyltransferase [Isosphaeraceae bacterium]|nr:cob(I)yrinic acid a,c-diamide adenosyltransferase [Isosphaeraceae bacterium]